MANNKLKFRAWDKRFQKYTNDVVSGERDDEGLSPYSEGEIYPFQDIDYLEGLFLLSEWYSDRLVIEQCTGLKDKHENLIYEGDLVNLDGYGVCEVIWSEDTAEFMFQNLDEDLREHVDTMFMYDWEVVGNIHDKELSK